MLTPGKSAGRKCGDDLLERDVQRRCPFSSKKRGRPSGIFTRANRSSPSSASTAKIASESESPEMYGNGWPGPTASGVSTG